MKILLLDDHPLFREGLALLLHRLSSDLQLLQTATCDEAFALCEAQPDIELILLDLSLVPESVTSPRQHFTLRVSPR